MSCERSAPLPATGRDRWLIEPVEFMKRALALPPLAANGRPEHIQQNGARGKSIEHDASERSQANIAS